MKNTVTSENFKLIHQAVTEWAPDVKESFVRMRNVYTNRYRVNVYTKFYVDNEYSPRTEIAASFFVAIVGGTVVDLTIQSKAS